MTAEDVKDPDNVENLCCMSYLEKKVPEFQQKMQDALSAGKRDIMQAYKAKWIAANQKQGVSELFCATTV